MTDVPPHPYPEIEAAATRRVRAARRLNAADDALGEAVLAEVRLQMPGADVRRDGRGVAWRDCVELGVELDVRRHWVASFWPACDHGTGPTLREALSDLARRSGPAAAAVAALLAEVTP